jgi:hypothetical protein
MRPPGQQAPEAAPSRRRQGASHATQHAKAHSTTHSTAPRAHMVHIVHIHGVWWLHMCTPYKRAHAPPSEPEMASAALHKSFQPPACSCSRRVAPMLWLWLWHAPARRLWALSLCAHPKPRCTICPGGAHRSGCISFAIQPAAGCSTAIPNQQRLPSAGYNCPCRVNPTRVTDNASTSGGEVR